MEAVTNFQVASLERSDTKSIVSPEAQGVISRLIGADITSHSHDARPLVSL